MIKRDIPHNSTQLTTTTSKFPFYKPSKFYRTIDNLMNKIDIRNGSSCNIPQNL